jgi:bifunctional ADP-heptose synthase (sugar kinase/adenylyltransferase)
VTGGITTTTASLMRICLARGECLSHSDTLKATRRCHAVDANSQKQYTILKIVRKATATVVVAHFSDSSVNGRATERSDSHAINKHQRLEVNVCRVSTCEQDLSQLVCMHSGCFMRLHSRYGCVSVYMQTRPNSDCLLQPQSAP